MEMEKKELMSENEQLQKSNRELRTGSNVPKRSLIDNTQLKRQIQTPIQESAMVNQQEFNVSLPQQTEEVAQLRVPFLISFHLE